jgi:glycosyltransferase involved in cell wall biosynthesis
MTTATRHPLVIDTDRRGTDRLAQVIPFRARPTPPKLRILHVSFSPRIGGSERYCIDLANQQAALGYDVHVAGLPGSPIADALAPAVRFHVIDLPVMRAVQLGRLIARLNIDVAHAHLSPACKALARVRATVRKVATLHVGYKPRQHARMDGVICVNSRQVAWLSGYAGQARVIGNWLPAADIRLAPQTNLRDELGLSADTLIIGAAGRLHASKGCDLLVKAFREAAPANAVLVFLGEGKQRKDLEKLRGGDGRVYFLGFRNDVAAFLNSIDLFVSPSREESFGLAIVEAMNAGLPVIATKTDGPMEYLKTQPVVLVEPGSVSALSAALSRHIYYLPAPKPRYDLRLFDPAMRVAQIIDFYAELTGQDEVRDTGHAAIAL